MLRLLLMLFLSGKFFEQIIIFSNSIWYDPIVSKHSSFSLFVLAALILMAGKWWYLLVFWLQLGSANFIMSQVILSFFIWTFLNHEKKKEKILLPLGPYCISVPLFTFCSPVCTCFCVKISVRVSNELGRGSSRAAKFSIVQIVLTSFAIGFVLFIFFLFFRGRLAYIFTESSAVAAAVADLSPLLACSILLNSVQPVLSGKVVLTVVLVSNTWNHES